MSIFGLEALSMEEEYLEDDFEDDFDDEMADETFTVTAEEMKKIERQEELDNEQMETETVIEKKRKKVVKSGASDSGTKKDREFDDKKKLAEEISKHPHIFDIIDPSFCDKQKQHATWNQIAVAVNLPVDKCISHWNSLKRSAKYYANDTKIAYKSGASAVEMSSQTYRAEWPFRNVMSFYTPPSLREGCGNIVLSNIQVKPPSTKTDNTAPDSPMTASDAVDTVFFGDDRCYDQTPTTKGKKRDQLAESVSMMANTFSSYFQYKAVPEQQPMESPVKPTLKYQEMWSNFDKLVSKLDEDTVDDLNIQITNLIGAALKKKRQG
ncbi:uncharacterized protein LOC129573201 [Sitodiplosis mosellana]|uniref:uncharacterized protein LOC129573201 n=1 Tax=Sitodiplosis mosellana TaxID=263140 RepID=UPI002443D921|nr:uncharacterized protein LOC129573201 [Sitodiplosis mosellana]